MSDCYWSLFNQKDQKRYDGLRTMQARTVVSSIPVNELANWLAWKEGTPEWIPLLQYAEILPGAGDGTSSNVMIGDDDAPDAGSHRRKPRSRTVSDPNFRFEGGLADASEFNMGIEETDPGRADDEGTKTTTRSFQHLNARSVPDVDAAPASKAKGKAKATKDEKNLGVFVIDEEAPELLTAIEDAGFQTDLRKSTRYRRKLDVSIDLGNGTIFKTKTVNLSIGGCEIEKPLPEGIKKKHLKIRIAKGRDNFEALCEVVNPKGGGPATRFRFLDVNRIDLLRTWLISPG